MFPLIPLPIKEAITQTQIGKLLVFLKFPLIPLPIKEAIVVKSVKKVAPSVGVSINSTSYKRSDEKARKQRQQWREEGFPLIPLPIKEAILVSSLLKYQGNSFPLIPLPIKEAIRIASSSAAETREVSINSTSYKRSDTEKSECLNPL